MDPSTLIEPETSRLDCYTFGRKLLETNDLDPVYVLVWEAGLRSAALWKWLLSYWCFYHVGTASWAVDQGDYWGAMEAAASSSRYPRSSERRHFRGAAALASVADLKRRNGGGYEDLSLWLDDAGADGRIIPVTELVEYVKTWTGFGPWIAFKVADMVERLGLAPVAFDLDTAMYGSPLKGALDLWEAHNPRLDPDREPGGLGAWAVDSILSRLSDLPAPPRYERPVGVQEAETILCKWHAYLGGGYHVGEDVAACRRALAWAGRCPTAQRLYRAGKGGGLWT